MNFAAMATWPALALIAAAVALAVFLFLLKIKPPQILVPSLTLWSRVMSEQRDQTLWERIRKAVSLAIAVLVTLAIALAILRPQLAPPAAADAARTNLDTRRGAADRVSIVLDSSWSMLAQTSDGRTRWDRALARARVLATAAAGDEIVLSTTADGVVEGPTPDVALIEAALDRIAPSGGDPTSWPRVEGARVTYFLTDGAVDRPLDAGVTVESVFEPAANVAITAFDVRPGTTLDSAGQVFLTVANYAAASQNVHITLTRGSASLVDLHADVAPGAAVERVIPLDRGGDPKLRARVSAPDNALVIDDEAVAWVSDAAPLAVAVVSDHPESFGPLLSQDPSLRPLYVLPKNYTPGRENLVIFDRVLPAVPAKGPALFIEPPSAPPIRTRGLRAEMSPDLISLLDGVDMASMTIDQARTYPADGLVPLATSEGKPPLIYARDQPDQRFVLFAFNVTDSKLMFAPGFPALIRNTIAWLAHPATGGTARPGLVTFPDRVEAVTGPDGQAVPFTNIGAVSVAKLGRVGLYQVVANGATAEVAVNAGDPEVSNLQASRLAKSTSAGGAVGSRGRPWWLFAAATAFLLLAAEWWTWQRRVTV